MGGALPLRGGTEARSATVYYWAEGAGSDFFDDVSLEVVAGE